MATVKELWEQSILPYNLPLTILLVLVVLFWLRTIVVGAGEDLFDGDVDVDADAAGGDSSTLLSIVNAGAVPLTLVLSILILMLWIAAVALNYYFNPDQSIARAMLLDAGGLVLAVIATKLVTQPLVPVMRRLKAAENAAPVIGETGVVRSLELDAVRGQVEVERPDGAPALLNARLVSGGCLPRGARVEVEGVDETGVYLVSEIPVPSITSYHN